MSDEVLNMNKDHACFRTDFLFPTPSFLKGMGTVLNLGGNYYSWNRSDTPEEADARGLKCDWAIVGEDIRRAFSHFISREWQNK